MPKPSPRAIADFDALKQRYPAALFTELPSGAALVSMPTQLPQGWDLSEATLHFIIPNGYAVAPPDCFWIEPSLTVNKKAPKSSELSKLIPETQISGTWFSWHVEGDRWSANSHDLLGWHSSCLKRLEAIE